VKIKRRRNKEKKRKKKTEKKQKKRIEKNRKGYKNQKNPALVNPNRTYPCIHPLK